jgi:2-polyprenyl-6-methoxyphenol hydroxylase-like FAD-dependent oxidoreductase
MTAAPDQAVLVVGGGISGLTAATAFAQKGIKTVLIESKAELTDEAGVGLTLVGNALRALDTIGVAQHCVAQGVPADSLALCKPDGSLLTESPLPRIGGPDLPGSVAISRTAFHAILALAAGKAGVDIRCGLTVADWQEQADTLDVRFSDGSSGQFALMIGADGLYSTTREQLFTGCQPQPAGQAVWRAECPRPDGVDRSHIHFGGKHGVVGICPIAKDRAYLYIVENAQNFVRRETTTLHLQMQDKLAGYGGQVAGMSAQLDDSSKVSYRPLEWLLAPEPRNMPATAPRRRQFCDFQRDGTSASSMWWRPPANWRNGKSNTRRVSMCPASCATPRYGLPSRSDHRRASA